MRSHVAMLCGGGNMSRRLPSSAWSLQGGVAPATAAGPSVSPLLVAELAQPNINTGTRRLTPGRCWPQRYNATCTMPTRKRHRSTCSWQNWLVVPAIKKGQLACRDCAVPPVVPLGTICQMQKSSLCPATFLPCNIRPWPIARSDGRAPCACHTCNEPHTVVGPRCRC